MIFQEIRQEHERLLRQALNQQHESSSEVMCKKVFMLLQKIRNAGYEIENESQRSSLESYAKKWGNYLYRNTGDFPDVFLYSFDKTKAKTKDSIGLAGTQLVKGDFFGRREEIDFLKTKILRDECRLIEISGSGGVGKTTLVKQLFQDEQVFERFKQRVVRRTVRIPLALEDLLAFLLKDLDMFLNKETQTGGGTEELIKKLVTCLSECSFLLVIEDFEGILQKRKGEVTGVNYDLGYENYSQLLSKLVKENHKSCLILTSREKVADVESFKKKSLPAYSLVLGGLKEGECLEFFRERSLLSSSTEADLRKIIKIYDRNPYFLKIVASTIVNVFASNVKRFLEEMRKNRSLASGEIESIFNEQFYRLSNLEQLVAYWLAVAWEPVSIATLQQDLLLVNQDDLHIADLHNAVEILKEKSFVETEESEEAFSLYESFMEYVTNQLVENVFEELTSIESSTQSLAFFDNCVLLKASAKAQVREHQREYVLEPLVSRFKKNSINIQEQLESILKLLQTRLPQQPKYAVGNILNLLVHSNADLSNIDCSGLMIHQAHFHNVMLHKANFKGCILSNCIFEKPFSSPLTVAFQPNSKNVAVGNASGKVYLFGIGNGQQFSTVNSKLERFSINDSHTNRVRKVIFSPNGSLLASTGDDSTIKIHNLDEPENEIQVLPESANHQLPIWSIAFSRDKDENGQYAKYPKYLASASDDQLIKIWEWNQKENSYQFKKNLEGHGNGVWGVCFHPHDDKLLASASGDGTVRLWNLKSDTQSNSKQFPLQDSDRCLEGELDDANEGGKSGNEVWCVAFSPNGDWLARGNDKGTVKLWKFNETDKEFQPTQELKSHEEKGVLSVTFSPEGNYLASSGDDESIQILKLEANQWKLHCRLCKHTSRVWSVSFSDDSDNPYLVSCSDDQTVRLWQAKDGSYLDKLQGFSTKVLSVAFHPKEKDPVITSAHEDGKTRIWRLNGSDTLNQIGSLDQLPLQGKEGHRGWVWSVAYSPDGKWLASSSDDETIRIWEVSSKQCFHVIDKGHVGWIRCICFSPDGRQLASASDDKIIKIWDVSELGAVKNIKLLKTLRGHTDWVRFVAFNQTGELLASASDDKTVRIWDVRSGESKASLKAHTKCVYSVSFSPCDPMRLVTGSEDGSVIVWDLNQSEDKISSTHQTLGKYEKAIWSVAFSPDGQWIASGSDDRTVRIWNLESGESTEFKGQHESRVRSVAFSSDGQWLASGSEDETIRLWKKEGDQFETVDKSLRAPRPYEGMKIKGISGLSEREIENLKALGAIDEYEQ